MVSLNQSRIPYNLTAPLKNAKRSSFVFNLTTIGFSADESLVLWGVVSVLVFVDASVVTDFIVDGADDAPTTDDFVVRRLFLNNLFELFGKTTLGPDVILSFLLLLLLLVLVQPLKTITVQMKTKITMYKFFIFYTRCLALRQTEWKKGIIIIKTTPKATTSL